MSALGSCSCGAVRFEITQPFTHFFVCHCSFCQKDSGSAFAANLFTHVGALRWLAGEELVSNFRKAETRHVRSFCSCCGSAVANAQLGGDLCIVPAGSLDQAPAILPEAHLFVNSATAWEESLSTLPRFSGFPQ